MRGANCSFMVLIPKRKHPSKIHDYRLISLVGCIYKVISKILTNRLKEVINNIISKTQSTFIFGRYILDGILVANEIVDDGRSKKKEVVLFKVDFKKVYGCVDWNFLMYVMEKLGFPMKWCNWILECLSSSSISVLVNGSLTNEFKMSCGLKKGGSLSLSLFLFLIAVEAFNVMMKKAIELGKIKGYKFDVGSEIFSHLQYADDTLIICEKSWSNICTINGLIILFESMSGLKVNFLKSSIVGFNVPQNWLAEVANVLNCDTSSIHISYLRLAMGANSKRVDTWSNVINLVKSRLSSWKSKHLSVGGQIVILKSVLYAILVYFLSFFKAPTCIILKLESIFK